MKTKNFRFNSEKASLIENSLKGLENQTLQNIAAESVKGGEWRLSAFIKSEDDKIDNK